MTENAVTASDAPMTVARILENRLAMDRTEVGTGLMAKVDAADEKPVEAIMQFFSYAHLPPHMQAVSAPFSHLAHAVAGALPRNAERTVALRKILEAKDAAVRALIAK